MIEIRKAIQLDDIQIASISVEGWKYVYRGIMSDEVLDSLDYKERAKGRSEFLKTNSLSTYVCTEAEALLGFVDFAECRDSDCDTSIGEVWAIYVLPEYIGRNLGKKLLYMAVDELAGNGFQEVVIWVLSQNKLARNFYERQGFVLDGTEKTHADTGLLEVRYRKILKPSQ